MLTIPTNIPLSLSLFTLQFKLNVYLRSLYSLQFKPSYTCLFSPHYSRHLVILSLQNLVWRTSIWSMYLFSNFQAFSFCIFVYWWMVCFSPSLICISINNEELEYMTNTFGILYPFHWKNISQSAILKNTILISTWRKNWKEATVVC